MAPLTSITKEPSRRAAPNLSSSRLKHARTTIRAILLASMLSALCWWVGGKGFGSLHSTSKLFQWGQITPSEKLVYHDCWDGKQCARLEVPMDWNETEPGPKVAIAIIKIPAKVHVADPRYGGPILINPGGPGGSGISLLFRFGLEIQQSVDASVDVLPMPVSFDEPIPKYFDIVSFDPRGVNNTTPTLACFPNSFERLAWNLQAQAEGLIGLSPDSFPRAWARAKALGRSCAEAGKSSPFKNDHQLGNFLNTTPVVRDILEMVERLGEWREHQARQWLSSGEGRRAVKAVNDEFHESAVLERTHWFRGQEKLLFYGFSYGTVIGTTFAAMYPERVGRAILDGVVDASDYYNSSSRSSIQDSDKSLDRILQLCFESGHREKCGLYDPRGVREIKSNLFSIMNSVKKNPVPVMPSGSRGPQVITVSDIDMALYETLHQPLDSGKQFFDAVRKISLGDGSWFAEFKRDSMISDIAEPPKYCNYAAPWTSECQTSGVLESTGSLGIQCTDGTDIQDRSPEAFKVYWDLLNNSSKVMGTRRAANRLACTHWEMRPKWRFTGPLEGKTQYPLLLIGNTLDPATPLSNAHKVASGFPGAVVLQHDALGHCTIAAPSLCTAKVVRQYFQTGELPAENTICKVDELPFIRTPHSCLTEDSQEDRLLFGASKHMARQGISPTGVFG